VSAAGFDRDHRRVDRAGGEGSLHASDERVGGDAAMQEQHVDQGAGAVTVPETATGLGPVPLMGRTKHTASPGPGQCGGAGERAGLDGQHFEVVVQGQDLVTLEGPGVTGHDHRPVEDLDGLGADPDIEPLADMAGRHGVEAATDRDPALAVHPMAGHHADVERFGRQATQGVGLEREVFRDG
jgi:hypothetical protein